MKRINVIQYIAYFPPHVGGMETHAAERAKWRVKKGYGECLVATYDIGQSNGILSYELDGYTVVCIPAFEIIPTFPCPKFRKRNYWLAHRKIGQFKPDILITRTRFFLSSLLGGCFAIRNQIKRIHIEHGSGYVKMDKRWMEWVAWVYDQTIGRLIFRMSDQVIGISQGCKQFIQQFTSKEVPVIYRGIEFIPAPRIEKDDSIIRVGFVGRLAKLKGIDLILQACSKLREKGVDNFTLAIVGDGEERARLENISIELALNTCVTFLGYKDKTYLCQDFYPRMNICVNSSWQEGLPTSVIEALLSECLVVATDVGGTKEISDRKDLILVEKGNIIDLQEGLAYAFKNYQILRGLSYEKVKVSFNWHNAIEEYHKLFTIV